MNLIRLKLQFDPHHVRTIHVSSYKLLIFTYICVYYLKYINRTPSEIVC